MQRVQRADQMGRAAIGIGGDKAIPATLALLHVDQRQMFRVDFRDQQRHIGIIAMIAGIAADDIAGRGKVPLRLSPALSDGRALKTSSAVDARLAGMQDRHRAGAPACRRADSNCRHRHSVCLRCVPKRTARSISNQGWPCNICTNRWPTAPVAPSTPTLIFVQLPSTL